jgi:hypothetical protein
MSYRQTRTTLGLAREPRRSGRRRTKVNGGFRGRWCARLVLAVISAVAMLLATATLSAAVLSDSNVAQARVRIALPASWGPGLRSCLQAPGTAASIVTLDATGAAEGALDVLRRDRADVVVLEPPQVARAITEGLAAPLPESLAGRSRSGSGLLRDRAGGLYGAQVADGATAIAINTRKLAAAGLKRAVTRSREWRLSPGGPGNFVNWARFERLLFSLTRDRDGGHGNPGYTNRRYDYSRIVTYGMALGSDYASGENTWASVGRLPGSAIGDRNPWPRRVDVDHGRIYAALQLLRRFMVRGYIPKVTESERESPLTRFKRGGAAMAVADASEALAFARSNRGQVFFASPPFALGSSAPIVFGQAAVVSSKAGNRERAIESVRSLTSASCQAQLADTGVALPALRSLRSRWTRALVRRGVDPSAAVFANQESPAAPLVTGLDAADQAITAAFTRVLSGANRSVLSDAEPSVNEILRSAG